MGATLFQIPVDSLPDGAGALAAKQNEAQVLADKLLTATQAAGDPGVSGIGSAAHEVVAAIGQGDSMQSVQQAASNLHDRLGQNTATLGTQATQVINRSENVLSSISDAVTSIGAVHDSTSAAVALNKTSTALDGTAALSGIIGLIVVAAGFPPAGVAIGSVTGVIAGISFVVRKVSDAIAPSAQDGSGPSSAEVQQLDAEVMAAVADAKAAGDKLTTDIGELSAQIDAIEKAVKDAAAGTNPDGTGSSGSDGPGGGGSNAPGGGGDDTGGNNPSDDGSNTGASTDSPAPTSDSAPTGGGDTGGTTGAGDTPGGEPTGTGGSDSGGSAGGEGEAGGGGAGSEGAGGGAEAGGGGEGAGSGGGAEAGGGGSGGGGGGGGSGGGGGGEGGGGGSGGGGGGEGGGGEGGGGEGGEGGGGGGIIEPGFGSTITPIEEHPE
ncbi:hypothetical protein [Kitasatospora sp. NPDC101183]|uniref:hypothetical protein n=1 Tax=Kitasatospora sp. NPDC101183 TaxID=3364100 RepID=UPI0037F330A5